MSATGLPLRPEPRPGAPAPLGATPGEDGVHFAVYSRHATAMTLCVLAPGGAPWAEIPLDPARHRTGDVWHVHVPGLPAGVEYGWRADGPRESPHAFDPARLLLDPWARGVAGAERWGERPHAGRTLRSVALAPLPPADEPRPRVEPAARVIYELHVRAFTRHASSGVAHPGTYAGLADKIPYLRALGVTSVQLMPVAEFDETDNPRRRPRTGEPLLNVWGYAPLAFLAPKVAYAADATPDGARGELRGLVRALHEAGIEVLLDVVYNHTGEDALGPARSWRGLDRATYYLFDADGRDLDATGCGHTFACVREPAADLVLGALRCWANEYGVDGFRFDLASALGRGEDGEPLDDPPILRRIAEDPALAGRLLVAEPWDAGGLYQVGRFPHHGRWAELNGRFRDDVRRFLRGAPGSIGPLATRLTGSSDLYAPARGPGHSINYVTSHDGFTLADLVAYERKHNLENGEGNRDGFDGNESWNCGAEGVTADPAVRARRARQVRNFTMLLLLAQGGVLWLWGDETLRSQHGNNNAWCQDGPLWWLDWTRERAEAGFLRFVRGLLDLRRRHPAFRRGRFFEPRAAGPGAIMWHGERLRDPAWAPRLRRVAMHLVGGGGEPDFALLVNGSHETAAFEAPPLAGGRTWRRIADTSLVPPHDFTPLEQAPPIRSAATHAVPAHTLVLLGAP